MYIILSSITTFQTVFRNQIKSNILLEYDISNKVGSGPQDRQNGSL